MQKLTLFFIAVIITERQRQQAASPQKIHIPMWLVYVLIFLVLCLAAWLLFSGKLFVKDLGYAGWSAAGYFIYTLALNLLFSGQFRGGLASGLCVLAVYLVICLANLKKQNK